MASTDPASSGRRALLTGWGLVAPRCADTLSAAVMDLPERGGIALRHVPRPILRKLRLG